MTSDAVAHVVLWVFIVAIVAAISLLLQDIKWLQRKVAHMADAIDDVGTAVTGLQAALDTQLAAIQTEIQQLAAVIASGTGLTNDQVARLKTIQTNLETATSAIAASTSALAADDPTPVPPPTPPPVV